MIVVNRQNELLDADRVKIKLIFYKVVGGNAWIDHIMPRSKFPELAQDIENLEWVTEDVNRAKQDKTPEEFLELIAKIYAKRLLC